MKESTCNLPDFKCSPYEADHRRYRPQVNALPTPDACVPDTTSGYAATLDAGIFQAQRER